MPRIIIENLGPIEYCDMDLDQFGVLTGPQASGKSTVAKAIFFFRTIKDDCLMLYKRRVLTSDPESSYTIGLYKHLRGKFMQTFGSSWGMSMDMHLRYEYDADTFAEISLKSSSYEGMPNYIFVNFSSDIGHFLSQISHIKDDEITAKLTDLFHDDFEIVYIPAGRSMITLLTTQLNFILSIMDDTQKKSIDYCTQSYMERILRLKPLFTEGISGMYFNKLSMTTETVKKAILRSMMQHIDKILKGKYQYMEGEERLVLDEHRYVKLNYTSSGQQEVVWILNLLFYYVLENRKVFVILEEPESHLYPEAQSQIAELLGMFLKAGNSMLLTTHSPYILGSINNLLHAGNLGKRDLEAVKKIIPEVMQIDSDHTSAYYAEKGVLSDIIDKEIDLIRNAVIDGISECINEQSEQLLEIALQN